MKLRVAGVDPSLNNFGMCLGTIDLEDPDFTFDIEDLLLVETDSEKENKKQVRKNSDDLRRAMKLHRGMNKFIESASMVFIEVPVGSQSARSMASYGICIGVIASVRKPIIQLTPSEVKLATVGSKTASKQEMIDWASSAYPDAQWLKIKRGGEMVLLNKNEHLADSVAAVHAGVLTETFLQATAMLGVS